MKRDGEFAGASHEQEPVPDRERPEQEFDIVDEASIESFLASDPPVTVSRGAACPGMVIRLSPQKRRRLLSSPRCFMRKTLFVS